METRIVTVTVKMECQVEIEVPVETVDFDQEQIFQAAREMAAEGNFSVEDFYEDAPQNPDEIAPEENVYAVFDEKQKIIRVNVKGYDFTEEEFNTLTPAELRLSAENVEKYREVLKNGRDALLNP